MDHDDTRALFKRLRSGAEDARDALIERFLPLARQLARRYHYTAEPLEDLVQVASLALIKAVDGFDVERGVSFSSYAVPTIIGELKRHFRDRGWTVHVPRGLQERVLQVDRASRELEGILGRPPAVAEIAQRLGAQVEDVLEAMQAASAYAAVSLDERRGSGDVKEAAYGDSIGTEDARFELVELGATIAPALRALPERERLVLHLRFVEDLTQSQIAERVGVSQMHVSRLLRRALERLRTVAEASEHD